MKQRKFFSDLLGSYFGLIDFALDYHEIVKAVQLSWINQSSMRHTYKGSRKILFIEKEYEKILRCFNQFKFVLKCINVMYSA